MTGTVPLRRVAHIIAGQSPSGDDVIMLGDGLPFIQGNAEFTKTSPRPRFQCNSAPKRAREGDLLISVRAPVGALNWASEELGIGRGLAALRPAAGWDARYLAYGLQASLADLRASASGSTFDAVTADQLGSLLLPTAGREDQRRIADFLDDRVARIDQIIAARTQQVELASRKFQASIDRELAREARGEVEVRRLLATSPQYGCLPDAVGAAIDQPRYIRTTDILPDGTLNPEGRVSVGSEFLRDYRLSSGDVLVARSGSIGKCMIYTGDEPAVYAGDLVRLRFAELPPRLYWYFSQSSRFAAQLGANAVQSTILNFNADRYISMKMPAITGGYSKVLDRLDDVRGEAKKFVEGFTMQITLLQEYKQSLITAAVTGEFDVTTASTKIPEN